MQEIDDLETGGSSIERGVAEFFKLSEISFCRPGILLEVQDTDAEILIGLLIPKLQPLLGNLRENENYKKNIMFLDFLEAVRSNDITQAVKIGSTMFQINREVFFKNIFSVILDCKEVIEEKSPEQLRSDLRRKVCWTVYWLFISACVVTSAHQYLEWQKITQEIKKLEKERKYEKERDRQQDKVFDEFIKKNARE